MVMAMKKDSQTIFVRRVGGVIRDGAIRALLTCISLQRYLIYRIKPRAKLYKEVFPRLPSHPCLSDVGGPRGSP